MANKLTQDAGLMFNVNTVKQHMIHFFETQDIYFEYKDKTTGEMKKKLPMFSGSQVAMAAALEKLCTILVRNAHKCTDKDKSGLRTVTRPRSKLSVLLDDSLSEVYSWKMRSFNRMQVYSDQLPVASKEFEAVVNRVDKNLNLTPRARNFICFLLLEAYLKVLSTAHELIVFAHRRTLDANAVLSSIRICFPDNLSHELCTEVSRAVSSVGDDVDEAGNDEDKDEVRDEENEDDSDIEEEAVATKKGGKTKNAAPKSKKAKAEQIDESEGEEVSDAEEEEEEVVVAAKPAGKKKAGGKKAGKSSPAKK